MARKRHYLRSKVRHVYRRLRGRHEKKDLAILPAVMGVSALGVIALTDAGALGQGTPIDALNSVIQTGQTQDLAVIPRMILRNALSWEALGGVIATAAVAYAGKKFRLGSKTKITKHSSLL
jgi:hypothetical protein